MTEAFIGLGGNLGDPEEALGAAVARLREWLRGLRVSSLYRTEPVGLRDQPHFLNAVVAGETSLAPTELARALAGIEKDLGRVRTVRMGPRTLDLDLLLYGDRVVDEPGLVVPHPRMAERRFVMAPFAEIAPEVVHPVIGASASDILAALPEAETVERLIRAGWPPAAMR